MKTPTIAAPAVSHIETTAIDRLRGSAVNPRTHSSAQIDQIANSINAFGFNNPILIDSKDRVIAGHGRLAAAKQLGLASVPTITLDHLNDNERRAYLIADNRLAEQAGWDRPLLAQELESLKLDNINLALTGFSDDDLAALTDDLHRDFTPETPLHEAVRDAVENPEAEAETSEATEPAPAVAKPGEIWQLGEHRVMCGDATNPDHMQALMQGEQAALVLTDPPYNVNYHGRTEAQLTIQNDKQRQRAFTDFLMLAFQLLQQHTIPTASLYAFHPSRHQDLFAQALKASQFVIRQQLVWVKNHFSLSRGRYHFQHEPIFYCHKQDETDVWYGDRAQTSVWFARMPPRSDHHPTMKPIELLSKAILNSSRINDVVLDSFGGAGSTLLACEQHHRQARLMELEPRYVDACIQRWEACSGQQARVVEGSVSS